MSCGKYNEHAILSLLFAFNFLYHFYLLLCNTTGSISLNKIQILNLKDLYLYLKFNFKK